MDKMDNWDIKAFVYGCFIQQADESSFDNYTLDSIILPPFINKCIHCVYFKDPSVDRE